MANPWEDFVEKYPVDTIVEGEVKNITEFGIFIGLANEIDGMVHMSDIDWQLAGEEFLHRSDQGHVVLSGRLSVM